MRRLLLALTLLAIVAGACTSASTPTASGEAKLEITGATVGELQALLQKRIDAVARHDLVAYQSTFDQTRTTWRRWLNDDYDIATRNNSSLLFAPQAKIARAEVYRDTYVRAYVDEGSRGWRRYYFRKVDGNWLLSEPLEDELGATKTKQIDTGLSIDYWDIDSDIADGLAADVSKLRDFLKGLARTPFRTALEVHFYPTASAAGPLISSRTLGSRGSNPNLPDIRIYQVWVAPGGTGMSAYTQTVAQHEGLHWLQDQFVPGVTARLDWWLLEGWPDYIGKVDRSGSFRSLVCVQSKIPTLKQLDMGALDSPDTPPELFGQYYAYANSMIEYLYSKYGNDAYWDLMTAYKDDADANVDFPKVLHVTPDQFYADWLAFARKTYC